MTTLIKSKWTRLKRIRLAHRGVTGTVSIFALLIILFRFCYIPYSGNNDIEGDFLDYPWLSSFLYSAGVELSFLSFSLILAYSTRFMEEGAKKPFMFLAYCIAFVALFFTSWVILPEKFFTLHQEVFISLVCSTLAIISTYHLSSFFLSYTDYLKDKIRFLMRLIIFDSSDMAKDRDKHTKNVVEAAINKLSE